MPAIELQVREGFCVGLAAAHLGAPRGVLPLSDGRVLVSDMGRWDAKTGRLLLVTHPGPNGQVRTLLSGLDRPHGLQLGPDGAVYIGEASRIRRVKLDDVPLLPETVIDGLPASGRHPLKNFVFGSDGALYLNRGAPSDHCEGGTLLPSGKRLLCSEAEGAAPEAAIWRYRREGQRWVGEPYARGLRNSTALAFDPRHGRLWQGENSRDTLPDPLDDSESSPNDELNLILQGVHYGWPYCHDDGVADPTFGQVDCTQYQKPYRLLPAHAAPLGLAFYEDPSADSTSHRWLLIALHGYRTNGHRIIGYLLDDDGMPGDEFIPVVEGWGAFPNHHPLGAPTDIKVDSQGRIWATEDRNGTLLVISPR
jgi:glucose/arabinose dehydrogenase